MNIVVTGAGKGIGYELVKNWGKQDNTVLAISRNVQKLQGIKNVIPLSFDLTNKNYTPLEKAFSELGGIDILINNAGVLINKPFEELTETDFYETYRVNVFAVARITQSALPFLQKTTKPHVVNISSMGGVQGASKFPGLSAYSSSKAAVAVLTECLAEEYKETNVCFNALALGAVQTDMLEKAFPGFKAPMSPDEMASFISNFAEKSHNFIKGKIIPVSVSTP